MKPYKIRGAGFALTPLVALLAAWACDARAAGYAYTTLAPFGSTVSTPAGISDTGQITGAYFDGVTEHGFTYQSGVYTSFDVPGSIYTAPTVLAANGLIAGVYSVDDIDGHGFIYDGKSYTYFDPRGSDDTEARSINSAGEIVGGYNLNEGPNYQAFFYKDGVSTTLNPSDGNIESSDSNISVASSINYTGSIVGSYTDKTGHLNGFLYSSGSFTNIKPPSAINSAADFISDSGEILGYYYDGVNTKGFIDNSGNYSDISVNNAIQTIPLFSNSNSTVVGVFFDGTRYGDEGFAYDRGRLEYIDPPGSIDTVPTGLNSAGDIVGYYSPDGQNYFGFLAQPVPEPSTWALALVGFGGLGAAMRFRRKSRALA